MDPFSTEIAAYETLIRVLWRSFLAYVAEVVLLHQLMTLLAHSMANFSILSVPEALTLDLNTGQLFPATNALDAIIAVP